MLKAKDKEARRGNLITFAIVLVLTLVTMVLENVMSPGSLLFTVIKKGAVYSLVAVSMNLLNGFTGLFSLGQAGFMLLGAYAYAIFMIPDAARDGVYYLFDGFEHPLLLPGDVPASVRRQRLRRRREPGARRARRHHLSRAWSPRSSRI